MVLSTRTFRSSNWLCISAKARRIHPAGTHKRYRQHPSVPALFTLQQLQSPHRAISHQLWKVQKQSE